MIAIGCSAGDGKGGLSSERGKGGPNFGAMPILCVNKFVDAPS